MNILKIIENLKSSSCEILSDGDIINVFNAKSNLVIKIGFDPTTEKLHLGHVVILRKLRLLQDYGFRIVFLIGDFTAMIGDPSGRSDARKQIDREDVILNFQRYNEQIFKILNKDLTSILFNSYWLTSLSMTSIIKLMSSVTVSRLLERSDFKIRYANGKAIYMHEFIYPLLQAYDSIFINADLEIGGIDQKYNFLLTRDLQKKFGFRSQAVIMTPILKGTDGRHKMSKSVGNCINIDDDYYDMFSKVMSLPDYLVKEYFLFLGFMSSLEFDNFESSFENFMYVKYDLAIKIVSIFYSEELAKTAKDKFIIQFSKRSLSEHLQINYHIVLTNYCFLSDFLVKTRFVTSYSEFKRFLKQNAIKLNNVIITDRSYVIKCGVCYTLEVGKRKIYKFFLKTT